MINSKKIQTIGCSIKARALSTPGMSSINLVIIIDRKSDRIPLNIQWPSNLFDKNNGKLLPRFANDKECIEHNLIIEKFLSTANNLRLQYYAHSKNVSVKEFRHNFINYSSRENIIAYISEKIEYLSRKGLISHQSKKLNNTSLKILTQFKPQEEWTFDKITAGEIKSFQNWMLRYGKITYENGTKSSIGYAYNTAIGHIKFLKKYLSLAQEDKIQFENPFDSVIIPQYKPGHREILDKNELTTLYRLRKSKRLSAHESEVLDRYLLGCFTGLRKSDIEALNPKMHISNGRLLIKPSKTIEHGTQIEFKLPEQALKIIDDYKPHGFRFMESSLLNKTLKKVIAIAEIPKYIKFHSSRDCFAVLYLKFGGNLGDLKDILGHKKITTTEIYLKMGSDAKNDIMSMFDSI